MFFGVKNKKSVKKEGKMKRKIFGVVSIGIVIIVIGVVCQILKKDSISQERKENTETIQQSAEEKVIEINREIEGIEIKNISDSQKDNNTFEKVLTELMKTL